MVALLLRKEARQSGEAPILVGLTELGRGNALLVQDATKLLELVLVSNGQVDVGRVMVVRATMLVGVLNGGMCCLNRLLRERNVAAGDSVQVSLGWNLLHDLALLLVERETSFQSSVIFILSLSVLK